MVAHPVRLLLAAVAATVAAAALVALASAGPHARPRFTVVGHLDPHEDYVADVFALGRYAYLSSWGGRACLSRGVRIVDLARPARPRLRSRFADSRSQPELEGTWTEKTIVRRVSTPAFRGLLAVTSVQPCRAGALHGFALYDVTDAARPRQLALVPLEPRGSHEIWLAVRDGRPYVWTAVPASERASSPDGERPGEADFRIFDASSPSEPQLVSTWGAWRDLGIRPDGRGGNALDWAFVHSVAGNADSTRAYLSYWDLGTVILDVSSPARPRYLGRTAAAVGDVDNAHSSAVAQAGRVLVETHERDRGTATLWGIADPAVPHRLAEFRLPRAVLARGRGEPLRRLSGLDLGDSVHDVKVAGRIAYFSWYRQGVVAADISDPRRPRFLARFLPPAAPDAHGSFCPDAACVSVWGVFATPRYVLASDMLGGLWVLRFTR